MTNCVQCFFFFFSSRRRHTRCREVSWARRCVQETGYQRRVHGMMLAVEHLVKNGHRKIGLIIDGNIDMNASKRKRYVGFVKAVRTYSCVEDRNLIQMATVPDWMTEIGRIIRSGATAMICCGESSGFKVDYVMNLFGKKIPDEMSIITFENPITSKYCTPPHTTIGQDFERIVSESVQQLDSAIKKSAQPNDILIDYVLTERESVKKI
eukprot:TRINITY_DN4628_c0_g1_i2.p1 TRINITY_DN4628_c0_g1~~TRINITY_DN4628_c0_g1_i2.p1  ORF type:complete len:209 (-),score=60.83 TRINITY_DN4628_c0_g1_i2:558-1184(-)